MSIFNTLRAIPIVVAAVLAGAQTMTSAAETGGEASGGTVTLDVYSGRPNPIWSLPGPVASDLMRRIEQLTPSASAHPPFDGLGYRSVSAEVRAGGETVAVTASRGGVTVKRGGREQHYSDPSGRTELWLVNTGSAHVPPDALSLATREIEKRAK